jgi:hypothetical protein
MTVVLIDTLNYMTLLKVMKRDRTSIAALDVNTSVFRYWVDSVEVKTDAMKNGLTTPFLAMLNELIRPDPENYEIDSRWSFSNPIETTSTIGGNVTIINTYDGIKYIYRDSVTTILTAAQPATVGTYTGATYKRVLDMMSSGYTYTLTTNLNEAGYGLDGTTYKELTFWGGTLPVAETSNFTPQGYYPVQGLETGTHGKDGLAFKPLSFWNEVVSGSTVTEYRGTLTENTTGFVFDTDRIRFNMTQEGDALERYNPIDLITFAELIKLQYQYRLNATATGEM